MEFLVGYTGFVGSNINKQVEFDGLFNSKNYEQAFGKKPDTLIYSGIPAQKFIANKFPEQDMELIEKAIDSIEKIAPKSLVLISTIDVYKDPNEVLETTNIDTDDLHPYGLNRYKLEQWVLNNKEKFEKILIVRLPGLYGDNLKKNFIYDLINIIPSMLNQGKYDELSTKSNLIKENYILQDNGFYKCTTDDKDIKDRLKDEFKGLGFTALNFTDSRASFQFYNLKNLYRHIQIALENDIELINIATEPVSTKEIYSLVNDDEFVNELDRPVPAYNFKTIHHDVFGGENGYLISKEKVLSDIKEYIKENL